MGDGMLASADVEDVPCAAPTRSASSVSVGRSMRLFRLPTKRTACRNLYYSQRLPYSDRTSGGYNGGVAVRKLTGLCRYLVPVLEPECGSGGPMTVRDTVVVTAGGEGASSILRNRDCSRKMSDMPTGCLSCTRGLVVEAISLNELDSNSFYCSGLSLLQNNELMRMTVMDGDSITGMSLMREPTPERDATSSTIRLRSICWAYFQPWTELGESSVNFQ